MAPLWNGSPAADIIVYFRCSPSVCTDAERGGGSWDVDTLNELT